MEFDEIVPAGSAWPWWRLLAFGVFVACFTYLFWMNEQEKDARQHALMDQGWKTRQAIGDLTYRIDVLMNRAPVTVTDEAASDDSAKV